MKNLTNMVFRSGLGFSVAILAGCSISSFAPSIMSKSADQQHPTLSRALKNIHVPEHLAGCQIAIATGSYYRTCETEFVYQSVGPAPLFAESIKSGNIPAGIGPISTGLNAAMIATGAPVLGIGGLLLGMANLPPEHYPGLRNFKQGGFLYAVRFVATEKDGETSTPEAAEMEAKVPARISGMVLGHTSWKDHGSIWEPYELRITPLSESYEVAYKANPSSDAAIIAPVAVWLTQLRPLAKTCALTDQWAWGSSISTSQQEADSRKMSKAYPKWTFVLARYKQKPMVCVAGTCKIAPSAVEK